MRPLSVIHAAAPDRHKLVTLIAASSFVDRERRRQSVYDKKPQRYAEDNRTDFLPRDASIKRGLSRHAVSVCVCVCVCVCPSVRHVRGLCQNE